MKRMICSRWGCILPVGKTSPWGLGPTCDVCRQGLRASAFPPTSDNPMASRLAERPETCRDCGAPVAGNCEADCELLMIEEGRAE